MLMLSPTPSRKVDNQHSEDIGDTFALHVQRDRAEVLVRNPGSSISPRSQSAVRTGRRFDAVSARLQMQGRPPPGTPADPSAHLALARASVEYHERTDAGRLDDAVAAARKASKLWPARTRRDLGEGNRTGAVRPGYADRLRATFSHSCPISAAG